MNDLSGSIVGYLDVKEIDIKKSLETKRTYWKVKCKCGTEFSVRHDALLSKTTTSCGCKQFEYEDLTGQVFNELRVIKYAGKISYSETTIHSTSINLWECECSCGNILNVRQGNLKNDNTYSCGCLNRSHGEIEISNILNKWDFKFEEQHRFDDCKHKNTLPFDFVLLDDKNKIFCAIEFDGIYHTKAIKYPNMTQEQADLNLKTTKIRDSIKDMYCINNNIPLIRIPFTKLDDGIMESYLFDCMVELELIKQINIA